MEREHVPEVWVPVRFVSEAHRCAWCDVLIPRSKPGTTTGTRGTKAWWSKTRNVWECLRCREDGSRADEAHEEWKRNGGRFV